MAESDRPPSRPVSEPARDPAAGARPPASAAPPSADSSAGGAAADPPFEVALERLEALVDRLEGGELDLEDALARFEEGVALSRRLAERLGAAERRVERLLREGAGVVTRPLDVPGDGAGDAGREPEES